MEVDKLIDGLGRWPILQFGVVALVFIGSAYMLIRGLLDKKKSDQSQPPPPTPPEQRWFFDGPLIEALRYLRDSARAQEQAAAELRKLNETTTDNNRMLRDIVNKIDNTPSARRRTRD